MNGTKYFTFTKIETCDDRNIEYLLQNDCLLNNSTIDLEEKEYEYKRIFIIIKSIVVGKGRIGLEYNKTKDSVEFNVIITQPQRLIDMIHRLFIIVFQTLISTSMGLLIDVNTILKIIKMPKPVLIGFMTQYTCMPLVN